MYASKLNKLLGTYSYTNAQKLKMHKMQVLPSVFLPGAGEKKTL
jgi:hypothetical protein